MTKPEGDKGHEALKMLLEVQQRTYWESAALLAKGMTFYLAIAAALMGYVLTQDLPASLKQRLVFGGLVITALFFGVLVVSIKALLGTTHSMEQLLHELGPHAGERARPFFSSWRSTLVIISALIVLMGAIIVFGLVSALPRSAA